MHIHTIEGPVEQNSLLERMEKAGVYGGAIISQAPEESTEDSSTLPFKQRLENVLEWTKNQEGRLFPVLWIHPFEKDAIAKVKEAKKSGISAFKMICDTYPVYCEESMELLGEIEKTGCPVIFHSGILYSGTDTSKYNRPVDWECLTKFSELKFSLGHCSWPWIDECIAVHGKFLFNHRTRNTAEMLFDTTPGTPKIYRRELLTKIYTVGHDVDDDIMFGTDSWTSDYNSQWVKEMIDRDMSIASELELTDEQIEKMFSKNFIRFLGG